VGITQMGQGRGGFYTHEWVENLLGADIRDRAEGTVQPGPLANRGVA
jgi:hypothetical protein